MGDRSGYHRIRLVCNSSFQDSLLLTMSKGVFGGQTRTSKGQSYRHDHVHFATFHRTKSLTKSRFYRRKLQILEALVSNGHVQMMMFAAEG